MEYRILTQAEYDSLASRILYEDNHILVVNKLVGEITQGDKTGDECLADTYKAFIAQRDSKPGKVFMGIPHRLDRPVSGICILAKTSKALERLSAMFRSSDIHKTYWALCCDRPVPEEGHAEVWLTRNEQQNRSRVIAAGRVTAPGESPDTPARPASGYEAKLAKLNYRFLRSTDRYHLVEVGLLTGRHHQIRCQLSHLGCPIKGDLKYGAPRSNTDGGICLHAHEIKFVHPISKVEMDIVAPVPGSWKGLGEA